MQAPRMSAYELTSTSSLANAALSFDIWGILRGAENAFPALRSITRRQGRVHQRVTPVHSLPSMKRNAYMLSITSVNGTEPDSSRMRFACREVYPAQSLHLALKHNKQAKIESKRALQHRHVERHFPLQGNVTLFLERWSDVLVWWSGNTG